MTLETTSTHLIRLARGLQGVHRYDLVVASEVDHHERVLQRVRTLLVGGIVRVSVTEHARVQGDWLAVYYIDVVLAGLYRR